MTFAAALERNLAPRQLGDVRLSYEAPILWGETRPLRSQVAPAALGAVAAVLGLGTLVLLLAETSNLWVAGGGAGAAVALGLWVRLERHARARRAFCLHFEDYLLRLDFSTPVHGLPRTLHVPFSAVRDVGLVEQGDGRSALTVDFEHPRREGVFREVLAAHIAPGELEDAQRVLRVLRNAWGLDQGAFAEGPLDRFESDAGEDATGSAAAGQSEGRRAR